MFDTKFIKNAAVISASALPTLALAEATPTIDPGNTAWMLTSTVLVLFMTIPGLALFYAGMVRSKNVLSVMMQCFSITALATLLWVIMVYSITFTNGGALNPWIGGVDKFFLNGVTVNSISGTIPETVFMMFQMTFAIITPALIVGAFAERMKFSAMLWFMGLWLILVYGPVAHWVWGGGWLGTMGVLDYAGGTVVHINAGIAGFMAALILGPRKGYPNVAMTPHNLGYTLIGASMLWVGWFGFNAGSALAADSAAGMAMAVTHIASASAALSWMAAEWILHGNPSVLGIASGAVAGLVTITPASGSAGPMGAIFIGLVAGVVCFLASTKLKRAFGYDDSLDVFGVHATGGIIGAILTGVFADASLGGIGIKPEMGGISGQVFAQFVGVVVTLVYSGILSTVLLKFIDIIIGLRVTEEQEVMGLDLALHNERGYSF